MKNDNSNIKSKHRLGASGTVALMMLATVIAKGTWAFAFGSHG